MTRRFTALNPAIANAVNPDGSLSPEMIRLLNEIINNRRLNIGPKQPKTIASGVVEISGNFSYFSIDTESAAASDDLDTINGGNEGDVIFVEAANAARTVVLKDGTGNILTDGSVDLSLDNSQDVAQCLYDGTNWKCALWNIGA
jgi:hypothetical protein